MIIQVRKLGCPGHEEFAVGAVAETGKIFEADYAATYGATPDYIQRTAQREMERIRRYRREFTPSRGPIDPKDRIVILVDDGIATGATLRAAIEAVRERHPKKIVVASPVGAPDSVKTIRGLADEVVCLSTPPHFSAVGQWYRNFPQVQDSEVKRVMQSCK